MKHFTKSLILTSLVSISAMGIVSCGPTKTEKAVIAKMDSITQADSIAKAEAAIAEQARQDSIDKAKQKAKAKEEARKKSGILMSFKIPGTKTCDVMEGGKIKSKGKTAGSWHKAYGVIQIALGLSNSDGWDDRIDGWDDEIYEGFIIGDRLYYDFFGSEGSCGMSYSASSKTITWGCDQRTVKLSQCSSVKVTK